MDPFADDDAPIETKALAEATLFFRSLRSGDYSLAATAQETLRSLGWIISRTPESTGARKPRLRSRPQGAQS